MTQLRKGSAPTCLLSAKLALSGVHFLFQAFHLGLLLLELSSKAASGRA